MFVRSQDRPRGKISDMPTLARLLIDDEYVVEQTRVHVRVLWWPWWIAVLCGFLAGWAIGMFAGPGGLIVQLAIVLIFGGAFVWFCVAPFLSWYFWTYALTNLRIIEQRGVFTRTGRVIPLQRIVDVAYDKTLSDRLLGCGTLILHDASGSAGLRIPNIPRIEEFHRSVSRQKFALEHAMFDSELKEVRHDESV